MSAAWPRTVREASQPPLSEASSIWPPVRTPSLAAVLGDHEHCERGEGGGAGRGGAGKTTFAHRLGSLAGLPVVALDEHFWQPGLNPLASDEWITLQRRLTSEVRWIMGGDLGPYDVLPGRLERADTSSCWTSACSGAPGRHIEDQAKVGTSGVGSPATDETIDHGSKQRWRGTHPRQPSPSFGFRGHWRTSSTRSPTTAHSAGGTNPPVDAPERPSRRRSQEFGKAPLARAGPVLRAAAEHPHAPAHA